MIKIKIRIINKKVKCQFCKDTGYHHIWDGSLHRTVTTPCVCTKKGKW
jgi:hypothetical protein